MSLLTVLAACASLKQEPLVRETVPNVQIQLSPQERQINAYQHRFNGFYDLALRSYATSQRTQNGDAVDKAVSGSASQAYADNVAGINSCIQELKTLHADTAYLEKLVSALPKQ